MKGYARILGYTALSAFVIALCSTGASLTAAKSGGHFTASYVGKATPTGCKPPGECTLALAGSGTASFLGKSTEAASLKIDLKLTGCGPASGHAVLTSSTRKSDTITVNLSGQICSRAASDRHDLDLTFVVSGGTGTFKNATGNGTVTEQAYFKPTKGGDYRGLWQGTIVYP